LRRTHAATVTVPRGQVRVLESHHAEDFEMPMGKWPFHKIAWVATGAGRLESKSGTAPIQASDFLLLPAGWSHRFIDERQAPLTLVILCISRQFLPGRTHLGLSLLWDRITGNYPPGTPLRAKSAFHQNALSDIFRKALKEQGAKFPGWEAGLGALAIRTLVSFARNHCEPSEVHVDSSIRAVEGAIESIKGNLHERLTIDRVAEDCRLSPRRFTALFKQITGETFNAYLNRERIEYACQRLQETGHIPYACHESGFNDLAYFYRVFKKLKGMTPGTYLEQLSD